MMKMKGMLRPAALLFLALAAGAAAKEDEAWFDPWKLPAGWKIEKGIVSGKGVGALEMKEPVGGDFSLVFKCSTEEKANVEVTLKDKSGRIRFTFAFLGRYHSAPVVNGVKCCILKDDCFVAVDPKLWLYPGHLFKLKVRRHKNQYQMFVDHELGPVFVDEAKDALEGCTLSIGFNPEGKDAAVRIEHAALSR